MSDFSQTEENYLKAIFKICERNGKAASTNAISNAMNTSAASVTDMIKRLEKKEFIHYERYKGVTLTETGNDIATSLIRKHRLWEVFLVEKLDFSWDEVHEIAEQLEHIRSPKLVERLERYLGYPKFDPHGDPIPDAEGRFTYRKQILLTKLNKGDKGVIVGVYEHSPAFLQFLDQLGLVLGASVEILEKYDFDESLRVMINDQKEWTISKKVSQNLFLQQQ
jgi:DtxR family Mn-dependent transcriptional regulator